MKREEAAGVVSIGVFAVHYSEPGSVVACLLGTRVPPGLGALEKVELCTPSAGHPNDFSNYLGRECTRWHVSVSVRWKSKQHQDDPAVLVPRFCGRARIDHVQGAAFGWLDDLTSRVRARYCPRLPLSLG